MPEMAALVFMTMIPLRFCTVRWTDYGCVTTFDDGFTIDAYPHRDNVHYSVIAHRCGYADDLLAYCREHEFAHSFICEALADHASPVLWALAHGEKVWPGVAVQEEALVHTFQAWLRANQEPIIGGVDWLALKAEALSLLGQARDRS